MQGDETNPKVAMENNVRPVVELNHRAVRTNINFPNPVSNTCNVHNCHSCQTYLN